MIIIGYSGHSYVVIETFLSTGQYVTHYFDKIENKVNPYQLEYLGNENNETASTFLKKNSCFIAIGHNQIRARIYQSLSKKNILNQINAVHARAYISSSVMMEESILVCANASINAFTKIGTGVICNTNCIIEHECQIGDFAHIAPGAVLAGNVKVGKRSFIGANAVIKQGITIGDDVIVGAGTVVIRDIPDGVTVVGNPQRTIK